VLRLYLREQSVQTKHFSKMQICFSQISSQHMYFIKSLMGGWIDHFCGLCIGD